MAAASLLPPRCSADVVMMFPDQPLVAALEHRPSPGCPDPFAWMEAVGAIRA